MKRENGWSGAVTSELHVVWSSSSTRRHPRSVRLRLRSTSAPLDPRSAKLTEGNPHHVTVGA
ncbi:hypothetical protein FQA47_002391 [Oryzias melastigma]|uniref:Uncharacterized protein n=1 Tax=Oryzias melastigma TaxID=30732 RepID=A0A834FKC1_ORYME|nr:hypothetical protein FQA47_002391 [Oryzias melastigma]